MQDFASSSYGRGLEDYCSTLRIGITAVTIHTNQQTLKLDIIDGIVDGTFYLSHHVFSEYGEKLEQFPRW